MTKDRIDRLIYLDQLIRARATGTPQQLAQKLGLKPSGWYCLRDILINDLDWLMTPTEARIILYRKRKV